MPSSAQTVGSTLVPSTGKSQASATDELTSQHSAQHRFRKDPAAYLAALEQRLVQ